jgi:hypothetical protein
MEFLHVQSTFSRYLERAQKSFRKFSMSAGANDERREKVDALPKCPIQDTTLPSYCYIDNASSHSGSLAVLANY